MSHVVLLETKPSPPFAIARQAAARGHRITLVTSDFASYLRAPSAAGDLRFVHRVVEVPSTMDVVRLEPVMRALDAEEPIDALLTLSDLHLVPTAELAVELGLRFARPSAVRRTRDKMLTRRALEQAAVAQPRWALATTEMEAETAAARIGFPVVIKPVDGISSFNASIVWNAPEVVSAARKILAFADWGRSVASARAMLVEEYVEGPLVSCEVMTIDGVHHVLGVADKILSRPPVVAELGGSFPALPFPARVAVEEATKAALDAVGFDCGASHTELIVSARGPVIVEINGRLVGGMVPEMIDAALGSAIYGDLVDLHLGAEEVDVLELAGKPRATASIRAFYSSSGGVLRDVRESPEVHAPEVVHHVLQCRVGDTIRPLEDNTARLGFVITAHREAEVAVALAARIFESTRLEVVP